MFRQSLRARLRHAQPQRGVSSPKQLGIKTKQVHTVWISDGEWRFAQHLAADQPGWVTVNAYLRRVIVAHLEREAARIRWEVERDAAK
jgi:hypothetical protein